MPRAAHVLLGLANGELAEVEHARGEHRVGAAFEHAVGEVLERADAAGSDHRHAHRIGDRARQRQVEAVAVPSRSMLVSRISPAPASAMRFAH